MAGGKEEPCSVVLDFFRSEEEREQGRKLMNAEIGAGLSWPFDAKFENQEAFSQYFLSHSAFLLRVTDFEDRLWMWTEISMSQIINSQLYAGQLKFVKYPPV